ncbi:small, acid-soluble spore protein tlp [Bacillus sp. FJAT-22090]|uniref:small, acid-soluble spore protein tlp n=1 Tax=Bacillus sp. FJAT-22090 TaxID=1581038 RepID=UPI00119E2695|nr:small, acid-soluble spore protein tlp [Bacillus sp. FJAT-22090]
MSPLPIDSADNEERLKKEICNNEAAIEFTAEDELASNKEKNTRREDSLGGLRAEILAEAKSRVNKYI